MTNNRRLPSGVLTARVLVAAAARETFTVDELAAATGINRKTVATVLARYEHSHVQRVGLLEQSAPGRPSVRWALIPESRESLADLVTTDLDPNKRQKLPDRPIDTHLREDAVSISVDTLRQYLMHTTQDVDSVCRSIAAGLRAAGFWSELPWSNPDASDLADRLAAYLFVVVDLLSLPCTNVGGVSDGPLRALVAYWTLICAEELPDEVVLGTHALIGRIDLSESYASGSRPSEKKGHRSFKRRWDAADAAFGLRTAA